MVKLVNPHKFMTPEWYEWTHNTVLQVHEHFMAWTRTIEFAKVLEIGCGKFGWYHQQFREKIYVGLDQDLEVGIYWNKQYEIVGKHLCVTDSIHAVGKDWTQEQQFDLVFSHAVIDHSPNPDAFILASLEASSRYTYIMSYRGYFESIAEHKITKNHTDGYYYNDISVPQVRRLLQGLGHKYELQEVPTGLPMPEIQSELHIIVEK